MNSQVSTWVLGGVFLLGALIYFWIKQRPPSERRGLERLLFLWKKFGDIKRLPGIEEYGIVTVEGHGGFAVTVDSTTVMRYGRVSRKARTENEAETLRKRTLVMISRESDPNPLAPSAGRENYYQSVQKVDSGFRESLKKDAIEFAVADHKKKGAQANTGTMRLVLALIVVAVLTGAIWLSVPIAGLMMRG